MYKAITMIFALFGVMYVAALCGHFIAMYLSNVGPICGEWESDPLDILTPWTHPTPEGHSQSTPWTHSSEGT